MEIRSAEIEFVQVGPRLRSLDANKVAELAESMGSIGLQQPISIYSPNDETLQLVAGLHRLEAARKLGWEDIDCIFVDMDDLDRQLWEIDENLCRADLTELERAQHTAKRAEVVKQKTELKAKLAPNTNKPRKRGPKSKGQKEFVEQTAKQTGRSKTSIKRDKARGEKIPPDVKKEIKGTAIEDSGVQLDALTKATPDEQREAVKSVVLGHTNDVRDVLPGAEKREQEKVYKNLSKWWRKADDETRSKFTVNWITGSTLEG